jgi:hypothetical protein
MKFVGTTNFYTSSIPLNRDLLDEIPDQPAPVEDYDFRSVYRVPHTIPARNYDMAPAPATTGNGLKVAAILAAGAALLM